MAEKAKALPDGRPVLSGEALTDAREALLARHRANKAYDESVVAKADAKQGGVKEYSAKERAEQAAARERKQAQAWVNKQYEAAGKKDPPKLTDAEVDRVTAHLAKLREEKIRNAIKNNIKTNEENWAKQAAERLERDAGLEEKLETDSAEAISDAHYDLMEVQGKEVPQDRP